MKKKKGYSMDVKQSDRWLNKKGNKTKDVMFGFEE